MDLPPPPVYVRGGTGVTVAEEAIDAELNALAQFDELAVPIDEKIRYACTQHDTASLEELLLHTAPPVDLLSEVVSAVRCSADVVRVLLSAGAPATARDHHGWTPLHWAAWRGHTAVVRSLLSAGADPSAVSVDQARCSALHLAAAANRHRTFLLILDATPAPARASLLRAGDARQRTPLHVLVGAGGGEEAARTLTTALARAGGGGRAALTLPDDAGRCVVGRAAACLRARGQARAARAGATVVAAAAGLFGNGDGEDATGIRLTIETQVAMLGELAVAAAEGRWTVLQALVDVLRWEGASASAGSAGVSLSGLCRAARRSLLPYLLPDVFSEAAVASRSAEETDPEHVSDEAGTSEYSPFNLPTFLVPPVGGKPPVPLAATDDRVMPGQAYFARVTARDATASDATSATAFAAACAATISAAKEDECAPGTGSAQGELLKLVADATYASFDYAKELEAKAAEALGLSPLTGTTVERVVRLAAVAGDTAAITAMLHVDPRVVMDGRPLLLAIATGRRRVVLELLQQYTTRNSIDIVVALIRAGMHDLVSDLFGQVNSMQTYGAYGTTQATPSAFSSDLSRSVYQAAQGSNSRRRLRVAALAASNMSSARTLSAFYGGLGEELTEVCSTLAPSKFARLLAVRADISCSVPSLLALSSRGNVVLYAKARPKRVFEVAGGLALVADRASDAAAMDIFTLWKSSYCRTHRTFITETPLRFQLSPIQVAAKRGHLRLLSVLIDEGLDPWQVTNNDTALSIAMQHGKFECAAYLASNPAGDINAPIRGLADLPPLHAACIIGEAHLVRALLDAGADPRARCADNDRSATALHCAAFARDVAVVGQLLKADRGLAATLDARRRQPLLLAAAGDACRDVYAYRRARAVFPHAAQVPTCPLPIFELLFRAAPRAAVALPPVGVDGALRRLALGSSPSRAALRWLAAALPESSALAVEGDGGSASSLPFAIAAESPSPACALASLPRGVEGLQRAVVHGDAFGRTTVHMLLRRVDLNEAEVLASLQELERLVMDVGADASALAGYVCADGGTAASALATTWAARPAPALLDWAWQRGLDELWHTPTDAECPVATVARAPGDLLGLVLRKGARLLPGHLFTDAFQRPSVRRAVVAHYTARPHILSHPDVLPSLSPAERTALHAAVLLLLPLARGDHPQHPPLRGTVLGRLLPSDAQRIASFLPEDPTQGQSAWTGPWQPTW